MPRGLMRVRTSAFLARSTSLDISVVQRRSISLLLCSSACPWLVLCTRRQKAAGSDSFPSTAYCRLPYHLR